jgi:hypothetical protein
MGNKKKSVQLGCCPNCHNPVQPDGFKDEESKREFKASGLCGKCQDGICETISNLMVEKYGFGRRVTCK